MTIDPVKIPQNVYVEDRIVGPVTLRQILICLLTGAMSYGIFSSIKASGALTAVSGILAWTPLVIGAAFAFVKINGISLTRFCLLFLERMDKPIVRTWQSRRGITISISTSTMKTDTEVAIEQRTEDNKRREDEKRKRIQELSALLDKGPDEGPESGAQATSAGAETDEAKPVLPVDRDRISAHPMTEPAGAARSSDLVRDITPPKAA